MTKAVKHIVSFSGGMGSFAEAKSCCEKYGKENVLLLFADTMMEDEDLYRFKDEVVAFLGCELVTLADGRTPWELFRDSRFVGNSRMDICSAILKRNLLIKWIGKNYGYIVKESLGIKNIHGEDIRFKDVTYLNAEVHLGIDFSEHHRLTRVQSYMNPWVYRSTLVEDGKIVPKDFSEKFGIAKPRLYTLGFGHNNCGGFCVKAGLGHFKNLYEKLPERYKEHEDMEQLLAKEVNTLPFLKKTIDGKTHYLTMKTYREEYLEKDLADSDRFDVGGCGCAI